MCRESLSLSNLTRLYGIDPSSGYVKGVSQDSLSNYTDDGSLSMRKPYVNSFFSVYVIKIHIMNEYLIKTCYHAITVTTRLKLCCLVVQL